MNIGQVAKRTGLPAKTIRYYEEIGLVNPDRTQSGYRDFSEAAVHKLDFIGQARGLGFGIQECRELIALWEDGNRAAKDVRNIAQGHLEEISAKIDLLQAMRATLQSLVTSCAGDDRPECPILDRLSHKSE